jgi:hypothetical protein
VPSGQILLPQLPITNREKLIGLSALPDSPFNGMTSGSHLRCLLYALPFRRVVPNVSMKEGFSHWNCCRIGILSHSEAAAAFR